MFFSSDSFNYLTQRFIKNFSESLIQPLDYPFAWLLYPSIEFVDVRPYIGIGITVSILAGLLCLFTLPKNTPGKTNALLMFFITPILIDFSFINSTKYFLPAFYIAVPVIVFFLTLLIKSDPLTCSVRENIKSRYAIFIYAIGVLGCGVAFITLCNYTGPSLVATSKSSIRHWDLISMTMLPEMTLIPWCIAFGGPKIISAFFILIGGIWYCIVSCLILCSHRFGIWKDKKPVFLSFLWFIIIYHYATLFYGAGHTVRSVLYIILPSLIIIMTNIFLIFQTLFRIKNNGWKKRMVLMALAIPAQAMTFLIVFDFLLNGFFEF